MHKVISVLLSLMLFQMSVIVYPNTIDQSSEGAHYNFGAQSGPMGIRGRLDESSTNSLPPPLYRFKVEAHGRIVDGQLIMLESGACPVITIRFPLPLKLEGSFMYTFIGEDAGLAEQMFLVGGKYGRLLAIEPKFL